MCKRNFEDNQTYMIVSLLFKLSLEHPKLKILISISHTPKRLLIHALKH